MDFSDSSWQDCSETDRSKEAYIIFCRGGPIDHGTHVPGPFSKSSVENEYNSSYTVGMNLSHSGC